MGLRGRGLALALALAGCSSGGGGAPDMALDPLIAARPYGVTLPAGRDPTVPAPLIVVLHGYSATGAVQDAYLGISAAADAHGTVVAVPEGTRDALGNQFWNATDGCCNLFNDDVDDVAYLTALIHDATARYDIDPERVFLVGHSNGAFMAHRMACDRAELVTGIAALAGVVWKDMSRCQPSRAVAVAQIHGDLDDVILYDGGDHAAGGQLSTLGAYPGSPATFEYWATRDGCTGTTDGGTMDLDVALPGAETTVTRATGCSAGGAAELWRIRGAGHIPSFGGRFADPVYAFFAAHPRS